MVSFDIEGVVAPVFTPIDEQGQVALDVIPGYVDYLVKNGIKGILVGGTTGEAVSLSLDERKTLLSSWTEAAGPHGLKVVAQIGGVPMPEVLEMAKFAMICKADAIMTLPEIYYKPRSVEQLVTYLATVSKAAPSLPLIYYHFPMMSGVEVNIPEFFAMATAKIPNFKGMKADLGVAVQLADQLTDGRRIFIGNHMLAPAVLLGHESSIATVTNLFPKLVQEIVGSVKSGDIVKAKETQLKMNSLVSAIIMNGEFLPSMKAAMQSVTGIRVGPPRQPQGTLNLTKQNEIQINLTKLGIVLNGC